jgi:hypothetical protein
MGQSTLYIQITSQHCELCGSLFFEQYETHAFPMGRANKQVTFLIGCPPRPRILAPITVYHMQHTLLMIVPSPAINVKK